MKVLVVDDEPLARSRMASLLDRSDLVTHVRDVENAARALEVVRDDRPDAVFLDISMPGISGLDLVLSSSDFPPVVFVTAHVQFGAKAFDADAVDYLLKPVSPSRLQRALEKLQAMLDSTDYGATQIDERVLVKRLGEEHYFDPKDITRFYSDQRFSVFRIQQREHFVEESLSSLEERLARCGFFRLHRSELINLHAVQAISAGEQDDSGGVRLSDGQWVRGSRRKLRELRKRLSLRARKA